MLFLVRVGWSADYAEALKQPVDAPSPAKVLPENWWQHPAALGATDSDIEIIKRQWGAFYGTDLELQLRRRGIDTIVLCGISTNIGVESTARNAWELGFNLVIAEDACSAASAEQQGFFPEFYVGNFHDSLTWSCVTSILSMRTPSMSTISRSKLFQRSFSPVAGMCFSWSRTSPLIVL